MSDKPTFCFAFPQFHREPGAGAVASPPESHADFEWLYSMTARELRELGLRPWCDPGDDDWPHDRTLMLLPGEWYQHIPDGVEVVDIFGNAEVFRRGESDDDIRAGCLAYGVLARNEGA